SDSVCRCTVVRKEANCLCERGSISRRNEQRVMPAGQELASRWCVSGDEWHAARERLIRLVRDHPLRLCGRAEDSKRAARSMELAREALVLHPGHVLDVRRGAVEFTLELSAADDSKRDLRCESRRGEDGLDPVERDQLADEERVEGSRRLRPRLEQSL